MEYPTAGSVTPESSSDVEVRRILLKRFPIAVNYVLGNDTLYIVAIADLRRRPGYWHRRLEALDIS